MRAGKTKYEVGTRVRITSLRGADDHDDFDLVGKTGTLTHPFPGLMWPGVSYIAGVRLDDGDEITNLCRGDMFEVVEPDLP